MVRASTGVILIALCASGAALGQPAAPAGPAGPGAPAGPASPGADPGAPQDPYATPPGRDPVLSERIAEHLVSRAQELLDARVFVDAKQLAVEALVESPKGKASEQARAIIKQINQQLGIKDDLPAEPEVKPAVVDTAPIEDPTLRHTGPAVEAPVDGERDVKLVSMIHGGFYGGMLGASIGGFFDSHNAAAGAVPTGIAFAAGAALLAPRLTARLHWDEAQIRTAGAGSVWGGMVGGFFTEAVAGANTMDRLHGSTVLAGIGVGSTLGMLGGGVYANQHKFTRGDVALVDTFAAMGTAGGLTLGMLMQPAQKEGYSLNAALGAAGGVVVGMVAAPQTNTTPRRMLRVAGITFAGGALPFALLAFDHHSAGLQRATGGLATVGLAGGAWLGFYLTRHVDEGLDVPDHKGGSAAPPVPLQDPALAPATPMTNQHAITLPIAIGRF